MMIVLCRRIAAFNAQKMKTNEMNTNTEKVSHHQQQLKLFNGTLSSEHKLHLKKVFCFIIRDSRFSRSGGDEYNFEFP